MKRSKANMLLLAAGAIWGMGFVAQSTAMDDIGPLLFVGLRFACAAIAIVPFAMRESTRAQIALRRRDWLSFLMVGLALFGGIVSQQIGLLTTSVTNSGFLTGLYVVFVPFLAVAIFRDMPHWIVWPCAATAFAGIWLLSGGRVTHLTTGDWLTILCAVFWALQVIMITRFGAISGRPVTMAVTQFAVCAVFGLLAAVVFEDIHLPSVLAAAPEIVYAGVFSGGVAFTLQAIGQRHTTASQAAIFLSSEAVFAALFAAVLLSERLPAAGLAGCALILAAIIAVEAVPPVLRARANRDTAS